MSGVESCVAPVAVQREVFFESPRSHRLEWVLSVCVDHSCNVCTDVAGGQSKQQVQIFHARDGWPTADLQKGASTIQRCIGLDEGILVITPRSLNSAYLQRSIRVTTLGESLQSLAFREDIDDITDGELGLRHALEGLEKGG
ncbi:MAG TPA: hypothetical protein VF635_07410 [Propionibacteriaceae bacterium]|jgi:hypothetical protein